MRIEDAARPSGVPPPFLWPVKGTSGLASVQKAKQTVARAEIEERNRLLYVALTRARDRLYVAGFENDVLRSERNGFSFAYAQGHAHDLGAFSVFESTLPNC